MNVPTFKYFDLPLKLNHVVVDFTSIIIVNYKTRELTVECVRSLEKYIPQNSYEVIIVDNASNDGSLEHLIHQLPAIQIIESKVNVGFGAANNIGVNTSRGKYIFLLNPDTILMGNVLSLFIRFYKKNDHLKIGALGSLLVSPDFEILHSFGSNFPFGMKRFLKNYLPKNEHRTLAKIEKDYSAEVDIVVGANMFIEKKLFDEFNGFDTNIFLYEEELELQYRMRKNGYVSIVLNEKMIIHLEGKSSANYFKRKCSFLSLCYVSKKHLPYYFYLMYRFTLVFYAVAFFKNPRTTWHEKLAYLKLTIFKK